MIIIMMYILCCIWAGESGDLAINSDQQMDSTLFEPYTCAGMERND